VGAGAGATVSCPFGVAYAQATFYSPDTVDAGAYSTNWAYNVAYEESEQNSCEAYGGFWSQYHGC